MPPLSFRLRNNYVSRSERSKSSTFDQQSGMAYTEVVYRPSPMRAAWVWQTTGSTAWLGACKSPGPGCSTLREMAIRKACMHVLDLTSDSLKGVDWQVGQQLWRKILAYDIDSLHTWKVFATAYPYEEDPSLKRRYQMITRPNMALSDYIKPLTSSSCQWITFLSLSNITCARADLINISKLDNIGALTIGEGIEAPDTGLDDSIVRAWTRAAAEIGAFKMLRVFACRRQHTITSQILNYMSQFPALAIFTMEDCDMLLHKQYAKSLGWKYKTGEDLIGYLVSAGGRSTYWDSVLHACFRQSSHVCKTTLEGSIDDDHLTPVLHFSLGTTPAPAATDSHGDLNMRCFYRKESDNVTDLSASAIPKRPGANSDDNEHPSQKRRIMKRPLDPPAFMADFQY